MPPTRSEEAKQKVLDASRELLGETGIDGFTVEAVAKRSGVAKTTIYRHWRTGDQLLMATLDHMVQAIPTPNTGTLQGDLEAFMASALRMVGDPAINKAMLGVIAAASSDPEFAEIHQAMMSERLGPLRTIIDLAKGRGDLPADVDTELILDFIEGPFFMRKMIRHEPIDETAVRQLAALITAGLASLQ